MKTSHKQISPTLTNVQKGLFCLGLTFGAAYAIYHKKGLIGTFGFMWLGSIAASGIGYLLIKENKS